MYTTKKSKVMISVDAALIREVKKLLGPNHSLANVEEFIHTAVVNRVIEARQSSAGR